jgi:hypothetical protein
VKIWGSNPSLATDMWLVLSLDLRYHDLLRVVFVSKNGSFFKIIRLIEKKNRHKAVRFLPTSLLEMVVASKNSYPMSEMRLRTAVHECLSRLKQLTGSNIMMSLLCYWFNFTESAPSPRCTPNQAIRHHSVLLLQSRGIIFSQRYLQGQHQVSVRPRD